MKQNFWNRRIPTLFVLFLLVIGIGATTFLTNAGIRLFGFAASSDTPENIRITNITDTSFTVTYKTPASVTGTISVGNKDTTTKELFFDDRDQLTGIPAIHSIHSITANNLKPNTTYLFTITSDKTNYLNSGVLFTVTTGPILRKKQSQGLPLSGTVVLSDGNQPDETLVYVTASNGQTVSALTKSDGTYNIPLNIMRTNNISSLFPFSKDTVLQILVVGKDAESHVSLLANKPNPAPLITLGNNYDFTIDTTPLASSSAIPAGFSSFNANTITSATPQIITPQKDQKFTDPQPLLKGKALPNTTVQITVHSPNDIFSTVTTDAYGNWSFRPATPLGPGQHTITIVTRDASGILKTIQQTFTVFQSGVQVAEAATPSATPIVTITATPSPVPTATSIPTPSTGSTPSTSSGSPTPTPSPTTAPTLTPGISITPSLTPTSNPTPTPSPTLIPSPTAILSPIISPKPLPPTGNESAVTVGITALVTTVAGIVLFIFSKGVTL